VEIDGYLNKLEQLLAEARPVPLSASVMINRRDFDDVIADLRDHLPEELRQSRWVLKERDEVLEAASREADRLRADALADQDRLVSETEVARAAAREAENILAEAREQARVLRLEAEDYVDSKLAGFEIVLSKTMSQVERGRERLRGRLASDELSPEELDASGEIPTQLYDHESGR